MKRKFNVFVLVVLLMHYFVGFVFLRGTLFHDVYYLMHFPGIKIIAVISIILEILFLWFNREKIKGWTVFFGIKTVVSSYLLGIHCFFVESNKLQLMYCLYFISSLILFLCCYRGVYLFQGNSKERYEAGAESK